MLRFAFKTTAFEASHAPPREAAAVAVAAVAVAVAAVAVAAVAIGAARTARVRWETLPLTRPLV